MKTSRLLSPAIIALTALISLQCAHAMRLSPLDPSFTALGALPTGNLTVNTGSGGGLPTLNYAGGMLTGNVVAQASGPDIAVFVFDGGATLANGNTLNVSGGDRGLALLFTGSAIINGRIDVSGSSGTNGNGAGAGNNGLGGAGGPGGFAGGNGYDAVGGFTATGAQHGTGFGQGIAGVSPGNPSGRTPGGGGGYGTTGDQPFSAPGWGVAHGDLLSVLQGGSGGAGAAGEISRTYT